ncbi:hypothetical protein [Marinilactibacillus kalidii]|uniref:hypothetical protein n=1 Tax=Marinilactibacillus kalidii TaxID=2820274 RepID=UPI001ABEB73D|nr:hypothetical protein [Marinilactibacillus kalidii]
MLEVLFDEESINKKFNITLAERPELTVAKERYLVYEVPGRNGNLTVFDGYDNVPLTLHFNFIDDDVRATFREMNNWLIGKKKVRLSDTEMYRNITQSVLTVNAANNDIKEWCDFELEIITDPFEYEDAGIEEVTSEAIIDNPSKVDAETSIKVYGEGTCRVLLNDNQMIFKDVKEYVVVDGMIKKAHKLMSSKDNDMQGRYPVLKSGENKISIDGQTTKIEVSKRWCWR